MQTKSVILFQQHDTHTHKHAHIRLHIYIYIHQRIHSHVHTHRQACTNLHIIQNAHIMVLKYLKWLQSLLMVVQSIYNWSIKRSSGWVRSDRSLGYQLPQNCHELKTDLSGDKMQPSSMRDSVLAVVLFLEAQRISRIPTNTIRWTQSHYIIGNRLIQNW